MKQVKEFISNSADYLRNNRLIRILAKPYVDFTKGTAHSKYICSPDCYYLKTLKDIHKGERCFIIGNGPSLHGADLDLLCNEFTFAANRIFNIFPQTKWRPTYYMLLDDRIQKEIQDQLCKYDLGHIFIDSKRCRIKDATNKLTRIFVGPLKFDVDRNCYNDTSTYFSEDVSDHFGFGWTVVYAAIQLAVYMGFNRIYLLGVDHNYSVAKDSSGKLHIDPTVQNYFDNKQHKSGYPFRYCSVQYNYEIAREYCENHNIKIYNATRGGKLEVFERMDFDELMK